MDIQDCLFFTWSLFLEPLAHRQNVASFFFSIGITLVDVQLNWLNWFHFHFLEGHIFLILIDCMIFLSLFLDVPRLWNSQPIECFTLALLSSIVFPQWFSFFTGCLVQWLCRWPYGGHRRGNVWNLGLVTAVSFAFHLSISFLRTGSLIFSET